MKVTNYKENIISLGASDISNLVLVGITENGLESKFLKMYEDGYYTAYLIDESVDVPSHYHLEHTFSCWLTIYDDNSMVQSFRAKNIEIYRAGNFGVLIRICGELL